MALDITGRKIEVGDIIAFPTEVIKSVYSGIYTGNPVRARVHRIEELHNNFSYLEIILDPEFEYSLDVEAGEEGLIKIFSDTVALVTRNKQAKDTNKGTNTKHKGITKSFLSEETEFNTDKI